MLGLVLFLSHLAREIRVETMMHSVRAAADRTIHRLPPEGAPPPGARARHRNHPPTQCSCPS
ncbi:hypothetical protein [Streptomyces sp. ZL-24]|uniref:hypothetical protein n=1 Tax=Streptomyces sp. ZL-24 TaxID=1933029 RepID=UPI0019D4CD0E|nr:hypothetical protein [Streptomyces sp. ZL-24]